MFCPNGIGGGPRGCRAVSLLDSVSFSRTGDVIWVLSGSREVSEGGGSGTAFSMGLVGSASGGASSGSEETQSSWSTEGGG